MDRDGLIWFGLAITAALVAMPGVLAGGLPLLPLLSSASAWPVLSIRAVAVWS